MNMKYRLSEFGKHTDFKTLEEGIKYCKKHKITNGDKGWLWIIGKSRKECDKWFKLNKNKLKLLENINLTYWYGKKEFIYDDYWNEWMELKKYYQLNNKLVETLDHWNKQLEK